MTLNSYDFKYCSKISVIFLILVVFRRHPEATNFDIRILSYIISTITFKMEILSTLTLFIPLALYAFAVFLIFTGLYISANSRRYLLLPIWGFLLLSFRGIDQLDFVPGISYQFGMLIVITFLHTPFLFRFRKEPIRIQILKNGIRYWGLKTAYGIYNNPRMLVSKRQTVHLRRPYLSKREWVAFGLRRLVKPIVIVTLKIILFIIAKPLLASCTLVSFSPSREPIIRRLFLRTVTTHDILLRLFFSSMWILDSVAQLEASHALLSILFVAILRVDEPEEWPPLFGSPFEAYTLRRFWGRFWHQLFSPIAIAWAELLLSSLFSQMPLWFKKVFISLFVFAMSGSAHAIIAWRVGETAVRRDVFFFLGCFLGISFEVFVCRIWPTPWRVYLRWRLGSSLGFAEVLCRTLGYLWVMGFFAWLTPRLMYPKIYEVMVAKAPLLALFTPSD